MNEYSEHMEQAVVHEVVKTFFENHPTCTSVTSLTLWESVPYDRYDGDPWQFAACLYAVDGITVIPQYADPNNNPIVHFVHFVERQVEV